LALVERITGTRTVLPRDVVEVIVERTDGVPLFLAELTKTVLEGGGASDRNNREGAPPSRSVQISIPPTLHASLMARLDRLGPAAKEAAQIGAAIGREFTYELLAAVSPRRELECGRALELLVGSGLVFQRGVPPQASYLFKHALVQDAAYGALLRGARQTLHARIAEVLESRFPERVGSEPALLARHCAEAGLIEKAVEYFSKAGKQAIARSAMAEAVAMLRKALALLGGLSDGPVRWRHELALRAALGVALIAVQGYSASETGEVYARARVLCDRLGDMRALIRVASGQFFFHLVRSDMSGARGTAEDLLKAAEGADAPEAKVTAHQLMGTGLFHQGQLTAARAHLDRAAALEAAGRRDEVAAGQVGADPRIPGVAVPAYLGPVLCLQGRYSDARAQSDFAVAAARQSRRLHRLAFALGMRAWLDQLLRENTPTQLTEELAVLAKEQGFPYWTGAMTLQRAVAAANRGERSEAAALFEKGIRAQRAIGAISVEPWWAACVAPVLEASHAETLLAEQLRQVEATDERWCEADIYRLRGELARRRVDLRTAEAYLQEAVAIARRQEARHWELRAATSLARLLRDQGKRTEARDLLAPIYGWFTEGFGTPDLKEAKALLDELA
jgi:predicted ATPase